MTVTKPMLATATVAHETARFDVALPVGTTIAGLMATLRIDSTNPDLAIALPDGSPAPLDAVIGTDVPSGTLLTVASGELTRRAQLDQADATDEAWLSTAIATGATVAFTAILGVGVILIPLLAPAVAPGAPVRWAAGAIIALALITLALGGHAKAVGAGPLVVPGLIGLAAMTPFDPHWPGAAQMALATGSAIAALASFGSWQFGRRTSSATAALWGVTAAVSVSLAAFHAGPAQVGAALICTGVSAVLLAPSLATSVPGSQLLDLPLLSTSVPDVRVPTAPRPVRVTSRRVQGTVTHAAATTDTVTIAGVALAVIGAITLASQVTTATTAGLATMICLLTATVGLALVPRGSRSATSQVAPRIGAAIMLSAAVVGLSGESWWLAGGLAVMVVTGFAVVVGNVASRREEQHSALLGRSADILQGLSLGLLFPAAFVAADAFGLVWQATS